MTTADPQRSSPFRVVLAEPEPAVRERLIAGLQALPDVDVAALPTTSADAIIDAYRIRPHLLLLDLALPGLPTAETVRHIARAAPQTAVYLLVSSELEPGISAALDAGARDCLRRTLPPEALGATLERVRRALLHEAR